MELKLRHFTAAFNAGIEFAMSIAGQLDDRRYESVDEDRPHNLQDLIGTLSEMKLDESELDDVRQSLAIASFQARENDNPQEFKIDVVPVSEALRIFAECMPFNMAIRKALANQPDGHMMFDADGKPTFVKRLPADPLTAGYKRHAPVYMGSVEDSIDYSELPF